MTRSSTRTRPCSRAFKLPCGGAPCVLLGQRKLSQIKRKNNTNPSRSFIIIILFFFFQKRRLWSSCISLSVQSNSRNFYFGNCGTDNVILLVTTASRSVFKVTFSNTRAGVHSLLSTSGCCRRGPCSFTSKWNAAWPLVESNRTRAIAYRTCFNGCRADALFRVVHICCTNARKGG